MTRAWMDWVDAGHWNTVGEGLLVSVGSVGLWPLTLGTEATRPRPRSHEEAHGWGGEAGGK